MATSETGENGAAGAAGGEQANPAALAVVRPVGLSRHQDREIGRQPFGILTQDRRSFHLPGGFNRKAACRTTGRQPLEEASYASLFDLLVRDVGLDPGRA